MDNDKRDQPLTNLAALLVGQVAGFHMHKELLHLVAIVELAAGRTWTVRGVFQNLEVTLQTLRAFGLALLGFGRLLQTDSRKGMTGVVRVALALGGPGTRGYRLVALLAQIEIGTNVAVKPKPKGNVVLAGTTRLQKPRNNRIVELE